MSLFKPNRVTSSFNEGEESLHVKGVVSGSRAASACLLVVGATGNFASVTVTLHLFAGFKTTTKRRRRKKDNDV